jgi:hypothetical protein
VNKKAFVLIIVLTFVRVPAFGQVVLSGQTAVQFLKSAPTNSPRVVNSGRPAFGLATNLFIDGYVSDNVVALSNVSMYGSGYVSFDYLAIRLANLIPLGLNLQAGKFDLPFGNLAERRFPRKNPLFGLPLIYEYRTALPDHVTTGAEILASQGHGAGMILLDGGMYDLGVMLFGSVGVLDYTFALTSGTISATSYGGQSSNSDLGKLLRIAVTPITGLTIGGAYTWGAYLEEPYSAPPRNIDFNSYDQRAAEVDFEFSSGHVMVYGEGVYSSWQVPLETRDENFKLLGYYLESKYTLFPRFYAALRFSGLHFGNAVLAGAQGPWDHDVTEWEGGVGYFLEKDVLLKLVRRETRIHGGTMPKDNLTVLQLAVAY